MAVEAETAEGLCLALLARLTGLTGRTLSTLSTGRTLSLGGSSRSLCTRRPGSTLGTWLGGLLASGTKVSRSKGWNQRKTDVLAKLGSLESYRTTISRSLSLDPLNWAMPRCAAISVWNEASANPLEL